MYIVVCLGIDLILMEGVDKDLFGELFVDELGGYVCEVVFVIGYYELE